MKTLSRLTVAAAIIGLTAVTAAAQVTENVNVNANVNSRAKLTVDGGPVAFADADPDDTPSIAAGTLTVRVKARTGGAATPTLTVIAGGNLMSGGGDSIAIDNITWTVGGDPGFVAGTMNAGTAQPLGTWSGSGSRTGTQDYSLVNSWDYAPGTYSALITYTLTVP